MVKKRQQKRKLLDVRSRKELAIALLMTGGVITVGFISPALLAAAIPSAMLFKEKDKESKRKIRQTLSRMERDGLVKIRRREEKAEIILTEKGKKNATKHYMYHQLERFQDKKPKWDGKWRVVVFDIPQDQRIVRDAFRYLIKKLGMYQLQKSVWVYPHDCEKEVTELKEFFEIPEEAIRLIVTDSIGPDKKIRKKFNISK